jgi:glucose/arabinose dehydrogenase
MAFYEGAAFPEWQGNLFVGSLKFGLLVRLTLDDDEVVGEERMLDNAYGRIRAVTEGPDGLLYLLTDERNGRLLKVAPAE